MRFFSASCLSTRETVWVPYRNDATKGERHMLPNGAPAAVFAAKFAETFAEDVVPVTFGDCGD